MNEPRRNTISAPTTNRRRCLSSVSLPSEASMLDCDDATYYSTLPPAASIAALAPAVAATPFSLTARLSSPFMHDLGAHGAGFNEARGLERVEIDDVALQRIELVQQHFADFVRFLRAEADLRQTALQRHLAAFEARLDLALAGARELALVAAAGGLAEAGTDAATDAHAIFAGTRGWLQCVETHGFDSSYAGAYAPSSIADQVADLVDQTAHRRRICQFAHVVQLAQAERAHAETMAPLAAVRALEQTHAQLRACRFRLLP